jgi:hypothetical protein
MALASDDSTQPTSRRSTKLLVASLVLLCGLNFAVLLENRRLTAALARQSNEQLPERLVRVSGVDSSERRWELQFDKTPGALLFTFSSGCSFCQATLPHWRRLQQLAQSAGWQTVWISRDPFGIGLEFAPESGPLGVFITDVPARTYNELGLNKVPRTVIVDGDGRVRASILGALDEARTREIEAILGVNSEARW